MRVDAVYADGETAIAISSEKVTYMEGKLTLQGRDFTIIPHGSAVECVGYLWDGFVKIKGEVAISTESQLNIVIKDMSGKQERRSFLKVRTGVNVVLTRAFSLGRRCKPYRINETILTKDLSLGGVSFYSNRILFKKQQIEIDFSAVIPDLKVRAEVLRKERGSFLHKVRGAFKRYRYIYACRLLKVSGEAERALCAYVLRTQLENRKKLLKYGG